MKKLLLILLLIAPALAKAQTPITPSWARVNTQTGAQDSIRMTYSGQIAAQWYYSSAFIRSKWLTKIDTVALLATKYWTEHQPHIWYGDQTVNGNVIISGTGNQLIMDNGYLQNGSDSWSFNTSQRNGFKFNYYNTEVFRIAGTGHSADDASGRFSVPIAWNPSNISKFYPDANKRLVVQTVGIGGGDNLIADTIPFSKIASLAGAYTKTQVDSINALNTLQAVTYRNRYSNVSTVIGAKTLQNSPASLTTYGLGDSYLLPTGPYSTQLGAVQRFVSVIRHNFTNYAISGTTKAQLTPGDSSAVNRLYRIPTYNSSTMGYYIVWYPVNDCYNNVDTAVYRAANVTIANNLVSKGWPANKVIWGGQSYYNANSTSANISKYNYIDSAVAKTYGFTYVNTYEVGTNLLLSDGLHGNNTYNEMMGAAFIKAVNTASGADLTVKGQFGADGVTVYLPQTNSDKSALYAIADSAATQTNTNPLIRADLYSNTNSFQPVFRFGRNSGSINSKRFTPSSAITPNAMRLGGIQWGGNGGAGDLIIAEIYASVNGTPDATHVPTDINFAVQGVNTTNRQVAFSVVNNGSISANGTVTNGTSTLVSGGSFSPNLTSGINNARLYGLRVTPTFTPGSFTGVTNYSIGVNAPIVPVATQTTDFGTSTWNWAKLWGTELGSTTNTLTLSAGGANSMIFQTNGVTRATLSSIGGWVWPNYTTAGILTNDASGNITSTVVLPVGNGGTGQSTYTNGQLLIGNTTGNTLTKATLTGSASTGLTVTNGSGSINLSIDTVSTIPTKANSYTLAGLQTKLNTTLSNLTDNQLTKTANYTVVSGDFATGKKATLDLYVDATAGNVTITLPTYSSFAGYTIYVTKTDASVNTVTINTVVGNNTLVSQYQVRQFNSAPTIGWINH